MEKILNASSFSKPCSCFDLFAGQVTNPWCKSMGAICYNSVSVSGQCFCKLSLGGIIAIKKCLSCWSYSPKVKSPIYAWPKISCQSQQQTSCFFNLLTFAHHFAVEACTSLINHSCFLWANLVTLILYQWRKSSSMQRCNIHSGL